MSTYAEISAAPVVFLPLKSGDADGSVCTVNVNLDGKMRFCEGAGWLTFILMFFLIFLNGGLIRNLTIA